MEKFKKFGNQFFAQREFPKAIVQYSLGLALNQDNSSNYSCSNQKLLLLSNRAEAYIKIGLYDLGLKDSEAVLSEQRFHEKCLHRKVRCLWGLGRVEEAITFVENNIPKDLGIWKDLNEKSLKILNQSKGIFDIAHLLNSPRNQRYDIGEYVGPVSIVSIPGKGRGLVATDDIKVGQLIIASKAFTICFDEDVEQFRKNRNDPLWEHEDTCTEMVLEKVMLDENKKLEVLKLYKGDEDNEVTDLKSTIIKIMNFNAFRSIFEDLGNGTPNFSGLWILPSYLNHSCFDANAHYLSYGDILLVRAVKDIKAGEEITISYWRPNFPSRRKVIKSRHFECGCSLCKLEDSESPAVQRNFELEINKLMVECSKEDNDVKKQFNIVKNISKLRSPNMNVFMLHPAIEKVAANIEKKGKSSEKPIWILKQMEFVSRNNTFVESSVLLSFHICQRYMFMRNMAETIKWWNRTKQNAIAAYGSYEILKVSPDVSCSMEDYTGLEKLVNETSLTAQTEILDQLINLDI